jgi:hypothetical protein
MVLRDYAALPTSAYHSRLYTRLQVAGEERRFPCGQLAEANRTLVLCKAAFLYCPNALDHHWRWTRCFTAIQVF